MTPLPDAALTKSATRNTKWKNKRQNKQKHNFFSECAKRREKETQILTTHKNFIKTHIVQQTKHQLRQDINAKMVFDYKEWNLSLMSISYKMTKRTKTKKY